MKSDTGFAGSPLQAASKAAADAFVQAYATTYGVPTTITRCCNNYGPYQFPEKLIPLFVTNALDDRPLPVYGDGLQVRDWIHVDDHCRGIALVAAAGNAGEVYNIGGGTELTNRDITQRLLDAFGVGWEVVRQVPDRLGHDRRYSVDIAKITKLGWKRERSLDEALEETVKWYRDNRWWWEPLKGKK